MRHYKNMYVIALSCFFNTFLFGLKGYSEDLNWAIRDVVMTVYISMLEGFILPLHPVICVDVDQQVIFSIKPRPPLKKEKLRN